MVDCTRSGGEMRASAQYSVKIADPPPKVPFQTTRALSFQVGAGQVDRLTFSLGPAHQTVSSDIPWLYVAKVALKYDDASAPLVVGTAALVARPGGGQGQLKAGLEQGDYDCLKQNMRLLDAMYAIPATRSSDLDAVKNGFVDALRPDPLPAHEACGPVGVTNAGIQACFTYTKMQITAKVILSSAPIDGSTQIMMKIRPVGVDGSYTWVADYSGGQWGVGFIGKDDPATPSSDGSGCAPCTAVSNGSVVTLTSPVSSVPTVPVLSITTYLQDATDRANPTTISTVANGEPVVVTRGA